jgi:hypothetical protein
MFAARPQFTTRTWLCLSYDIPLPILSSKFIMSSLSNSKLLTPVHPSDHFLHHPFVLLKPLATTPQQRIASPITSISINSGIPSQHNYAMIPNEYVDALALHWGVPVDMLFDEKVLPGGAPEEWPMPVLSALFDLSVLLWCRAMIRQVFRSSIAAKVV